MVTFIAIEALIVYNIKQKIMTKLSKMAMLLMFFAITATTPMFISCSSGDDNGVDTAFYLSKSLYWQCFKGTHFGGRELDRRCV